MRAVGSDAVADTQARRSARRCGRARRCYWKVTGNVSELFATFFSPGTGCTVAVSW